MKKMTTSSRDDFEEQRHKQESVASPYSLSRAPAPCRVQAAKRTLHDCGGWARTAYPLTTRNTGGAVRADSSAFPTALPSRGADTSNGGDACGAGLVSRDETMRYEESAPR